MPAGPFHAMGETARGAFGGGGGEKKNPEPPGRAVLGLFRDDAYVPLPLVTVFARPGYEANAMNGTSSRGHEHGPESTARHRLPRRRSGMTHVSAARVWALLRLSGAMQPASSGAGHPVSSRGAEAGALSALGSTLVVTEFPSQAERSHPLGLDSSSFPPPPTVQDAHASCPYPRGPSSPHPNRRLPHLSRSVPPIRGLAIHRNVL